ncbi:hypothetical protein LOK74_03325 [Brevibacillus humidisoli]|nr:hypothetical protein [Brevibacillus humidisoli]UFJ43445.1 hypothetical protein LOK74_03325 [Brevibacillus humidisoli]
MKNEQRRMSNNAEVRDETNKQPQPVQDDRPGYGNKKLEGPNRPST